MEHKYLNSPWQPQRKKTRVVTQHQVQLNVRKSLNEQRLIIFTFLWIVKEGRHHPVRFTGCVQIQGPLPSKAELVGGLHPSDALRAVQIWSNCGPQRHPLFLPVWRMDPVALSLGPPCPRLHRRSTRKIFACISGWSERQEYSFKYTSGSTKTESWKWLYS